MTGFAGSRRAHVAAGGLAALAVLLGAMWVLAGIDALAGGRLVRFGIVPRDVDALPDVVVAPFLHAGLAHLIANTVPLLLLGAAIALSGAVRLLLVTALTAVVSGLGVWLVAPAHTVTIGASGVVFGFAAYLVARGVLSRRVGQLVVGLLVLLVWGTALLASLVPTAGISWQAHLFGGVGGVVAAVLLRRRPTPTGW